MARGWESKSVEEQQSQATASKPSKKTPLSPEQAARERQRQGLLLSRERVRQQLQAAHNQQHRSMLEAALADLDAQLTRLG